MKKFLNDALFLAPVLAIFAVGVGLYYINKSKQPELSSYQPVTTVTPYTALNAPAPGAFDYHHYDMSEPFAANVPFAMTPAAWMQMMNNMMNTMQITQMMHQMVAMPEKMMNPGMWMNPHAVLPNQNQGKVQQPMDPKEYKKWYEEQQKALAQ